MKIWKVDLEEVRFVGVDGTVKIERDVETPATVLGDTEEKQVLIARGKTAVVQLDFSRNGYINHYKGTLVRYAENTLLEYSKAIYELLKSRSEWMKKFEDANKVEVRVYREPYTEVHQTIYYIPEFNIYFADFDTMFELGDAEVKLKQFDVLYAPRFVAKLLDSYLQSF